MSWKNETRLSDLDPATRLEVTCRTCGLTRYETQAALMAQPKLRQAHLDAVEAGLRCANRFCRGPVRVGLVYDNLNEAFVGGMA
ncbi:MAG: hypothetical protein LDL39_10710 [Magnetospirillum sp.]|nr:hypothetical protein [Magnetospirillum sp.]